MKKYEYMLVSHEKRMNVLKGGAGGMNIEKRSVTGFLSKMLNRRSVWPKNMVSGRLDLKTTLIINCSGDPFLLFLPPIGSEKGIDSQGMNS